MMRALILALSAGLLALSGCTEIAYPAMEPEQGDGQATNNTVEVVTVQDSIGEDENTTGASYPHITSIVTTPYTAPVEITLARTAGEHARLALIAGPEGLRCEADPAHTASVPAGFKEVRTWTECSLLADDAAFTSAQVEGTDASLPMMDEVPVDRFTWNMTVQRVLVNNTGEHEELLEAVDVDMLAAPEAHLHHGIDQHAVVQTSSPYAVCDTLLEDGEAEMQFTAFATHGRPALAIDVSGHEVTHIEGPGQHVDAANASAAEGRAWWVDGEPVQTVHAQGAWTDQQTQLNITIDFQGRDNDLALLPPPECPDALFVDWQEIPVEASAKGIAAGWADVDEGVLPVEVWHTY